MADSYQTLAHLVTINDRNAWDLGVTDLLDDAPLLRVLAADESSNGTTHKYIKETTAPTVGFRDVNTGLENSKSDDTPVTVNLKVLDASFAVDKAVADGYHNGAAAYLQRESRRFLKAAFYHAENQIINGTGNEADGFDGLADELDSTSDTMVYNAGGSTDLTSIYLIRTNDSGRDCMVVMGNSGNLEVGDSEVQRITISGAHLPAYYTPIIGWKGLQVGSTYSVARIANVDDGSNKLDDDTISEALSLFPAGRPPNYIVCNRRSLKQLQQSRTATNVTGAPAPFPSESFGIPIVVTDSIGNSETQVTSS